MAELDYHLAICSHDRPEELCDTLTLSTLARLGAPLGRTTVLVEPGRLERYRTVLEGRGYLDRGVTLAEGRLGLSPNRNAMTRLYPPGAFVLSLNDDLADVESMGADGRWHPLTPEGFAEMVAVGFGSLRRWNATLWGVCNIANDFMARRYPLFQVGMPMIEGHLFGFVAGSPGLEVPEDVPGEFEDTERMCQVFASGHNVVKINRFHHKQNRSTSGSVVSATAAATCRNSRRLEHLYPRLVYHTQGKDPFKPACRAWPRRGRWVNNPRSLKDLYDLRQRVAAEKVRVGSTIHGEENQ